MPHSPQKDLFMKKFLSAFALFLFGLVFAQLVHINDGEKITYRIHYGFINAGVAELSVGQTNYKGKPHYRVIGKGYSTGIVNTFFKVNDIYESYIDPQTGLPSFYVRIMMIRRSCSMTSLKRKQGTSAPLRGFRICSPPFITLGICLTRS